jgi:hypothetical protein
MINNAWLETLDAFFFLDKKEAEGGAKNLEGDCQNKPCTTR